MVEDSKSFYSRRRAERFRAPVVYKRLVTVATEVPPKPKPEALLSAPDEGAFRQKLQSVNKRIRQLTRKLVKEPRGSW